MKPYPKEPVKKDTKANNKSPSMKVVQCAKDVYKTGAKTPEYSPHSDDKAPNYTLQGEEETPQYTPQPKDK